ncbi:MAG: choice-of-anchor L domain-containing protein [Solirubrobacteraceae bacterium]
MIGASGGRRTLVGALGALLLLAGLSVGGVALAQSKGKITLVSESHAGATLLARTMMLDKHQLLSGRYAALPPDNHPNAVSTEPLAGFPRNGKSYAILTNGCAQLADHHGGAGRPGCRDNGIPVRGTRDLTILRLVVRVPSNANCLSFRFRFLSQEFPKFVGSMFNDGFIAELDNTTWSAGKNGDINDPHISAPRNFAKDSKGNIITINAAGPAALTVANANGTTYGGATRVLRASTPITPGNHSLFLSIFDQGDRQFDSAVFIDGLTINRRAPCTSGVAATQ